MERTPDGEWTVGRDYLERAARYEAHQRSRTPVGLAVLSWRPLDQLPGTEGATWLDRQLTTASPEAVRAAGFGAEVEAALTRRRQWLLDQGFGREVEGKIVYTRNLLATLQRRELARAGARLAQETELDYVEAVKGTEVRGAYDSRCGRAVAVIDDLDVSAICSDAALLIGLKLFAHPIRDRRRAATRQIKGARNQLNAKS